MQGIQADYARFLASGGELKNAKHYNNVIGSHFLDIDLEQVYMKIQTGVTIALKPLTRCVSQDYISPLGYFSVCLCCLKMNATSLIQRWQKLLPLSQVIGIRIRNTPEQCNRRELFLMMEGELKSLNQILSLLILTSLRPPPPSTRKGKMAPSSAPWMLLWHPSMSTDRPTTVEAL